MRVLIVDRYKSYTDYDGKSNAYGGRVGDELAESGLHLGYYKIYFTPFYLCICTRMQLDDVCLEYASITRS